MPTPAPPPPGSVLCGDVASSALVCGSVLCWAVVSRRVVCGDVMCGAVVGWVVRWPMASGAVVSRGLVCATVVCGAVACGAMLCGTIVCACGLQGSGAWDCAVWGFGVLGHAVWVGCLVLLCVGLLHAWVGMLWGCIAALSWVVLVQKRVQEGLRAIINFCDYFLIS